MNYYEENEHYYVDGFANFMSEQVDEEWLYSEAKDLFKKYMWFCKNIKVDFRYKFWKNVLHKALKKTGYKYGGF